MDQARIDSLAYAIVIGGEHGISDETPTLPLEQLPTWLKHGVIVKFVHDPNTDEVKATVTRFPASPGRDHDSEGVRAADQGSS
jgi:hypothetical protein